MDLAVDASALFPSVIILTSSHVVVFSSMAYLLKVI
jgi:hypothetical protein